MANRMGLDGTTLHYLAVRKGMVSVHRPVHSKITLTYSLTWQTDRCTPQRMAFKALLNAKVVLVCLTLDLDVQAHALVLELVKSKVLSNCFPRPSLG